MAGAGKHSVRLRVFMAFTVVLLLAATIFALTPYGQNWLSSRIAAVNAPKKAQLTGDILTSGKKVYSQFNEELIIRDFFQDREGGVFVDVGCAWPEEGSTTCYLDKQLNWTGIAVDALESYRPVWEQARPRTKFFAYAVTDKSGERMKFYAAPTPTVSSLSKKKVENWKETPKEIEVETITLNKLLEDNKIDRIDFLSMDIEGAEPEALAGFDIERFRPSLVCIEINWERGKMVMDYLTAHGYELIKKYEPYDNVNWYFAPVKSSS